jgi:Lipase (class 3)
MNPFDDYAMMVLCAGDVDQIWHWLDSQVGNPKLPAAGADGVAYITDQYWEVLGQIRCNDIYVVERDNVYYGLLLKCKTAIGPVQPGAYMVAVRGTMNTLEWANDATAEIPTTMPEYQGGLATGFWKVYASMTYCDLAGANVQPSAATAIANIVRANPAPVFVTGHSLGAALATYLTRDLEIQIAPTGMALTPYFFASPKVGTQDYVDNYQLAVRNYSLVNFAADLVPMLPSSPPFMALNGGGPFHDVHVIPYNAPNAPALFPPDPGLNHSPITYAEMLDGRTPLTVALRAYQAAHPGDPPAEPPAPPGAN